MKIPVLLVIFILTLTCVYAYQSDRILLRDVQSLVFKKNTYAATRRFAYDPIPSLRCVGGSAQHESNHISTIMCTNAGYDNNVVWKCVTDDIPNTIKLGKISMICEGYNYPEDPYILKNSCSLEYNLEYIQKYYQTEHVQPLRPLPPPPTIHLKPRDMKENDIAVIFIITILLLIVFLSCTEKLFDNSNKAKNVPVPDDDKNESRPEPENAGPHPEPQPEHTSTQKKVGAAVIPPKRVEPEVVMIPVVKPIIVENRIPTFTHETVIVENRVPTVIHETVIVENKDKTHNSTSYANTVTR